jgi:hypothetical protein
MPILYTVVMVLGLGALQASTFCVRFCSPPPPKAKGKVPEAADGVYYYNRINPSENSC